MTDVLTTPRGVDPGRWAGTRQRWIEAGRGGHGETRVRRRAIAQELGISETCLYRHAKRRGWPRGNHN